MIQQRCQGSIGTYDQTLQLILGGQLPIGVTSQGQIVAVGVCFTPAITSAIITALSFTPLPHHGLATGITGVFTGKQKSIDRFFSYPAFLANSVFQ